MTLLLDTHVWLWMLAAPERLGATRATLEDAERTLLWSAASSWEISIKYQLGRLALPQPPDRFVPDRIRATGVTPIAIDHVHALEAGRLPMHHRDPFDRVLVAQARHLDVPIVTADPKVRAYDVKVVWVGP
jgi:PIN domain nuclease of toxin-antitoxin system